MPEGATAPQVTAGTVHGADQPADATAQTTELSPSSERCIRFDKRSQKWREIRADLQFMVVANRQAGGPGVYSGFRVVRTSTEVAANEEPYLGAFLPLKVARKYPELMAFITLSYEDVFVNEGVAHGTRMVVRPGKFRPYRGSSLLSPLKSPGAKMMYALVAVAALAGLAIWFFG